MFPRANYLTSMQDANRITLRARFEAVAKTASADGATYCDEKEHFHQNARYVRVLAAPARWHRFVGALVIVVTAHTQRQRPTCIRASPPLPAYGGRPFALRQCLGPELRCCNG